MGGPGDHGGAEDLGGSGIASRAGSRAPAEQVDSGGVSGPDLLQRQAERCCHGDDLDNAQPHNDGDQRFCVDRATKMPVA